MIRTKRGTWGIIDSRCNRRIKDYSPFVEKSRNSHRSGLRHRGVLGQDDSARPHEGGSMCVQGRVAPGISMQGVQRRDARRYNATLTASVFPALPRYLPF